MSTPAAVVPYLQAAISWILFYHVVLKPLNLLPADDLMTKRYEAEGLKPRFKFYFTVSCYCVIRYHSKHSINTNPPSQSLILPPPITSHQLSPILEFSAVRALAHVVLARQGHLLEPTQSLYLGALLDSDGVDRGRLYYGYLELEGCLLLSFLLRLLLSNMVCVWVVLLCIVYWLSSWFDLYLNLTLLTTPHHHYLHRGCSLTACTTARNWCGYLATWRGRSVTSFLLTTTTRMMKQPMFLTRMCVWLCDAWLVVMRVLLSMVVIVIVVVQHICCQCMMFSIRQPLK